MPEKKREGGLEYILLLQYESRTKGLLYNTTYSKMVHHGMLESDGMVHHESRWQCAECISVLDCPRKETIKTSNAESHAASMEPTGNSYYGILSHK